MGTMNLRFFIGGGLLASVSIANANLLLDSNFSVVGPNGSPTTHIGTGNVGWSAADSWFMWHNTNGVSTTQLVDTSNLLPSVAPSGATTGILVTSTAANNGLVQTFTSTPNVTFDAWVYVLQGQVTIGVGNGGSTAGSANSTGTGSWLHLSTVNSTSPADEAIIYSTGPAVYYVTSATVNPVPEPASIAAISLGVAALIRRKRRS